MAGIQPTVAQTVETPLDPRVAFSTPDPRRFAVLALPLALLLVVFKVYRLEQPAFFSLACLVFGGFAISYWLPFRFKESFLILLSLAGAYVLLSPVVASLLIAAGLGLFAVIRSSLEFRWKLLVLLGIAGGLAYLRASGRAAVPPEFWPVFGAIFMFRMIVYLYDSKHLPGPASLKEYFSYFFLLPNYYFLLFPVIDFQTFRKSFFSRDIHPVAQQGVWWIVRGTTHLLLYRLLYQLQVNFSPPKVSVPVAVAGKIVLCYLLYLRVSGQFHIITGMLHLFGYDLPVTNRYYLLANGLSDFWRRINIYWKDFMVKVVYFPVYFKLRRKGDLRAKLVATSLVFAATWLLHAYQFFWLQNNFRITVNDSLFWIVLGSVVVADVWRQHNRRKTLPRSGWLPTLENVAQIAMTFAFVSVLWSMWSAGSMEEWFSFLQSGNI
jgi:alginate O-acetyltransferase complex protein AlgI